MWTMEAFDNATNGSGICEFTSESPLPAWLIAMQAVFLIPSLVALLLLNVSYTVVVIIHKALHQKEMMISLVFTISNICTGVVTYIPSIASVINGGWPFGKSVCYAVGTASLFLAFLRFTFILAFTVDRFTAVMYPFQYPQHSAKVAAIIFIVGGMYSAVISLLLNANLFGCYNLDKPFQICHFVINCTKTVCYIFIVIQVLVIVSFGIVVPFVLNIVMFYQSKKLQTTIACGTIENDPGTAIDRRGNVRTTVTIALLLASTVGLTSPYVIFTAAEKTLHFDGTAYFLIGAMTGDLYALVPIADTLVIWRNRDAYECTVSLCKKIFKVVTNAKFEF